MPFSVSSICEVTVCVFFAAYYHFCIVYVEIEKCVHFKCYFLQRSHFPEQAHLCWCSHLVHLVSSPESTEAIHM